MGEDILMNAMPPQPTEPETFRAQANREELAGAVEDSSRGRYERLVKNKGENVVVGVQHGVCGGCTGGDGNGGCWLHSNS